MRGTVSSYENSNLMCIYYLYLRAFWELPLHIFVDEQLFIFLFRYLCRYWNFSIRFCLFMKLIDISLGQATISTGRVLGRSEWVNENGELWWLQGSIFSQDICILIGLLVDNHWNYLRGPLIYLGFSKFKPWLVLYVLYMRYS